MEKSFTAPDGPTIIHAVSIQLVRQPDGSIGVIAQSTADPIVTLGLLEAAKESIKGQQQPQSPLVVARGRVPGVS